MKNGGLDLFNIDITYPGMEIASELNGLETSIQSLGEFLSYVQEQYCLRQERKLEKEENSSALPGKYKTQYFTETLEEIRNTAYQTFPRFFRANFVVAIWALYESGVNDLCNYLKEREKKCLNFRDIRGKSHRDKLEKYFTCILDIDLPISGKTFDDLDETQFVRNIIAHRNGIVPDNNIRKKKLEEYIKKGAAIEIDNGYVILNDQYIRERFAIVKKVLKLIDRTIAKRYGTRQLIE